MRAKLYQSLLNAALTARRLLLYPSAWLYRRANPQVTVIGITGSAGKTTTKDICSELLSSFAPTLATVDSENYRISTAETLLRVRPSHRYCVLEMSGGKPGTLTLPLAMARPRIGVLTTIGREHYSAFRSIEAIAAEKSKIVESLPNNGIAVLNIDDPRVREIGEKSSRRVIWVGEGEGATIRLIEAKSQWPGPLKITVEYKGSNFEINTQLHGTHLALSVLSSLGVALAAGISLEETIKPLAGATPTEGRMQIVTGSDGVVYVRDDWKAPHWSIGAPFDFMASATANRKIVVVGTVSDSSLGPSQRYPRIAREVRKFADLAIFVGIDATKALKARSGPNDASIQAFTDLREADRFLSGTLQKGDLVLLKGTNPSDHLVRLILNRESRIGCWVQDCARRYFCDTCDQLYVSKDTLKSADQISKPDSSKPAAVVDNPETASSSTYVIAGLGNPGGRYHHTPHNVGYRILDALAETCGSAWDRSPEGMISQMQAGGDMRVLLFKPAAKMNLTGPLIQDFLVKQGSDASHCMIVHDDMDLELGTARFKRDGGDGGHRGVRSIIDALGTDAVCRVRVGVRRPGDTARAIERVLEPFSAKEEAALTPAIEEAVALTRSYLPEASRIGVKT